MKKTLSVVLVLMMVLAVFAGCGQPAASSSPTPAATPEPVEITFATTTSVENSGLLAYLAPYLKEDTGITMNVVAQGTGKAIQSAKDGNADAILVHAKSSEEKMIEEGYGTERIYFMYNYFVIVGPKDDPAGVKEAGSAEAAFKAISDKGAIFVSRGDESGTHVKEKAIWTSAIGTEAPTGEWFNATGQGMGATLTVANEKKGYCLTDKATFLANKANYGDLEILLEESEDLINQYSFVRLNTEKLTNVNKDAQDRLIAWFTSEKALDLIDKYGVEEYGEQLFYSVRNK